MVALMQRRPCLGFPTHQTASLPTTGRGVWPTELNAGRGQNLVLDAPALASCPAWPAAGIVQ